MASFKIKFKNLVPNKGLKICVLIFIVVISFKFSSSTPVPVEANRDELILTNYEGKRDMSCLKEDRNYLFDLQTNKCYLKESRGPCNRNMRFFNRTILDQKSEAGRLKRIGECDCIPNTVLPLVYHVETDSCFPLFRQSYCPKNQWLLYLKNAASPTCEPNPCLSEQSLVPEKYIVLLYGQCVALKANCDPPVPPTSSSGLPPLSSQSIGQFSVRFQNNDVHPTCSHPGLDTESYTGLNGVQGCRTGFKKDMQGRCRKSSNLTLSGRSSIPKPKTNNTTTNDDKITFGEESATES